MCNKATYSFIQEIYCTFLPHFCMLQSSRLMPHIFRVSEDLKWSPQATWMWQFIATALLWERENHCWALAILVKWANLTLCLFCTKTQTITKLESHQQWKCQINVLLQYIMCCIGEFNKPDKMTKCFKSIHFTTLFTICCPFLKINITAFTAQTSYPSANDFV